jgi:hypothetical protein
MHAQARHNNHAAHAGRLDPDSFDRNRLSI